MMEPCRSCKQDAEPFDQFCGYCGCKLRPSEDEPADADVQLDQCNECGRGVKLDQGYCPRCGVGMIRKPAPLKAIEVMPAVPSAERRLLLRLLFPVTLTSGISYVFVALLRSKHRADKHWSNFVVLLVLTALMFIWIRHLVLHYLSEREALQPPMGQSAGYNEVHENVRAAISKRSDAVQGKPTDEPPTE